MMSKKDGKTRLTRREALIGSVAIAAGLALGELVHWLGKAQGFASSVYLPHVVSDYPSPTPQPSQTNTPISPSDTPTTDPPSPTNTPITETVTPPPPSVFDGKVVHVRGSGVTNWPGTNDTYFYNYIDQDKINNMVQSGLQQLTGQTSWNNIWSELFTRVNPSGYQSGQKIAMKVSFNNSIFNGNDCTQHNNQIDAVPHIFIALLNGLVAAGVSPSDVIIYEASGSSALKADPQAPKGKIIPTYFRNPINALFSGVTYVGLAEACSGVVSARHGKEESLRVTFPSPPVGGPIEDRWLADVLYDASYLINVPIIKNHGGVDRMPVSLGLKNHYGTINYVYDGVNRNSLHEYMEIVDGTYYNSNFNPVAVVNSHPFIRNKTVLILGDALYGSTGSADNALKSWTIFGNQAANSLLFATDPVAIDCVMTDLLWAEGQANPNFRNSIYGEIKAYDPVFCAHEVDLGVCEGTRDNPGGNPLQQPYGSGYSQIDFSRLDI